MFESDPENSSPSNLHVFLGFLLGIVASLLCMFVAIFLGVLVQGRNWIFPLIDAIALVLVGMFALRKARQSSLAAGALISLSIALLLDAACAFGYVSR
jgi:uncharacterized membrane protein YccC